MNIYLLIARRFLFPRNGFRSNTINFISFVGLFIGAASIVLSISVLNGFQGILQKEAKKIYDQCMILQDAGVFAIEIEIVPFKVAEFISTNIDVFMIGMGSGIGCDAQYLFAEDILGYNSGHIPRHAAK